MDASFKCLYILIILHIYAFLCHSLLLPLSKLFLFQFSIWIFFNFSKKKYDKYAHQHTHKQTKHIHRPHPLRRTITSNNNNCNNSWTTTSTTVTPQQVQQSHRQQQQPQTTPLPPLLPPPPLPPPSWATITLTHWKWARSGRRTLLICFHWYFSFPSICVLVSGLVYSPILFFVYRFISVLTHFN